MTDPIADLLTRIRNACLVKMNKVDIPASRIKKGIVEVLLKEGYIRRYKFIEDGPQGVIRVYLKYHENKSVIQGIKRISKPGLRKYVSFDDLPSVRQGIGTGVISTSRMGVITAKEAKQHHIGGEYICKIW